jgi:tetratricopeptide (TPR) repeat protein
VNEVANPTVDIKCLISLYQCDLNLLKGNIEKAQENLVEFKSKFYGGEEKRNKSIEPIHKTMENLYNFLKIKVDYFMNIQFKLNKHLTAIEKNRSNKDCLLFYYNFLGIINMKQARYAYAEYCFKFCINIINQNSMQYLKYLSGVEYNLALCYFFTKKYDKSIEILNKLKELESMKSNPYLYYRLALCYIEQEFQKNSETFKKNNENDTVCKTIFNPNCEEPALKKRFLLVNQSLSPSLSEMNSQSNEKKEDMVEKEINNDDLISVSPLDFNEAIRALKECILIIRGYNTFNEQIYNILKPLSKTEAIDLKPLFKNEEEENEKNMEDNTQYKDIYDSAYLNLIFCLMRNEYYLEAIEAIEEFRENNNSLNNYKFILDNYTIEAYLKLGEFEKALNILSKDNFSYENPDEKGSFFSNSNHQVYDEITFRLALYINLIKINILNNNFKEAEKYVNSLLSLLNYPTEKELPPYVINIIVFYFLSVGKNEEAVQIIKFRRIPKFYNN